MEKAGECGVVLTSTSLSLPVHSQLGMEEGFIILFCLGESSAGGVEEKEVRKEKRGRYLWEGDSTAESCVSAARGHFTFSLLMARSITRFFLNLAFL